MEQSEPRFSVITVVYNIIESGRRDMFLQAVDSVQAQTCRSLERVVVDGASDDGTAAMLANLFSEGRINRCISAPDNGIYHAMNRGARQARGDCLLFLNSDDYYHDPRGLEKMSARLESSPADFACSRIKKNRLYKPAVDVRDIRVLPVLCSGRRAGAVKGTALTNRSVRRCRQAAVAGGLSYRGRSRIGRHDGFRDFSSQLCSPGLILKTWRPIMDADNRRAAPS